MEVSVHENFAPELLLPRVTNFQTTTPAIENRFSPTKAILPKKKGLVQSPTAKRNKQIIPKRSFNKAKHCKTKQKNVKTCQTLSNQ